MIKKKIRGLFDYEERQQKLEKYKDPLQTLDLHIDWEGFRPLLEKNFTPNDPKKGGRPPYDRVLLFKILILQHYYNLSNEQTEYQITDRLSFMNFLHLELCDSIPDSNTTRNFKEALIEQGLLEALFVEFGQRLQKAGLVGKEGRIVDATFVTAPRQRNTREENEEVKNKEIPEEWSDKKQAHKDTDATWTKKNKELYFGYKNHIVVDKKSKLIVDFETTTASVYDGEMLERLIENQSAGTDLHGDSAYKSHAKEEMLIHKEITSEIHEKGCRNHPLTEQQKESNRQKSKTRAKVEHIFAWMHRNCDQITVKTIGLQRAKAKITLLNLVYNMMRGIFLIKTTAGGLSIL